MFFFSRIDERMKYGRSKVQQICICLFQNWRKKILLFSEGPVFERERERAVFFYWKRHSNYLVKWLINLSEINSNSRTCFRVKPCLHIYTYRPTHTDTCIQLHTYTHMHTHPHIFCVVFLLLPIQLVQYFILIKSFGPSISPVRKLFHLYIANLARCVFFI